MPADGLETRLRHALRHAELPGVDAGGRSGEPGQSGARQALLTALRARRRRRQRVVGALAAGCVVAAGATWGSLAATGTGPSPHSTAAMAGSGAATRRHAVPGARCAVVASGAGAGGCVGRISPAAPAAGFGALAPSASPARAPDLGQGTPAGASLVIHVGRSATLDLPAPGGGAAWGSPTVGSWSGGGGPAVRVSRSGSPRGRPVRLTVRAVRAGTAEVQVAATCPPTRQGPAGCVPVEWSVEMKVVQP
ncbi:MAG: hypothetical protein ACRDY3_02955 [Acidimicrobiales bacterium]